MEPRIIFLVILFVLLLTVITALLGLVFYLVVRAVKSLIKWVKRKINA